MSLETRHTEKSILFSLLKAQKINPEIAKINEFNEIVFQLKATMEPEDVELVIKQVTEYLQSRID